MTALRQPGAAMLDDTVRRGFQMGNLRGGQIEKYFAWEGELKRDIPALQLSVDDGEICREVVVRHGEYAFAFQQGRRIATDLGGRISK